MPTCNKYVYSWRAQRLLEAVILLGYRRFSMPWSVCEILSLEVPTFIKTERYPLLKAKLLNKKRKKIVMVISNFKFTIEDYYYYYYLEYKEEEVFLDSFKTLSWACPKHSWPVFFLHNSCIWQSRNWPIFNFNRWNGEERFS